MDDNNLLLRILEERFDRAQDNYSIGYTGFLTPEEQSTAMPFFLRNASRGAFLYGGYSEAERRIGLFMPDWTGIEKEEDLYEYFAENPGDCPLEILEVRIPKADKTVLGHRDYLGALMGEGIKREKVGDILVKPSGAQIIVSKDISEFLKNDLTSVGRVFVTPELRDISAVDAGEIKKEDREYSISSPRLDNVISSAFGLSRKTACDAITKGLVFVDGVQTMKTDLKLRDGSKLVLRGKGKAIYRGITGTSRKGRTYIKITRYI